MNTRTVQESDYTEIISVIDAWWGGRHMSDMLPRLFVKHFQNTSFIAEENNKIIGFLIGFISQSYPAEAYIHFIGIHPDYRKSGIAKELYELFFNVVKKSGCTTVHSVTSPINKGSIAFHRKMGFEIENGNKKVDGISVITNYDGNGEDRVLFIKKLLD
ncbi:GNAT family N-acetyltransferase [Clostridium sp. Marseille-QA1073]